jgi:hypothetical protein
MKLEIDGHMYKQRITTTCYITTTGQEIGFPTLSENKLKQLQSR